MLDQIIGNAVKYRGENPTLFGADISSCLHGNRVFGLGNSGTGIAQAELPYIFDKGYIGSCQRSGGYRSTGMGLCFAKADCRQAGGIGVQGFLRRLNLQDLHLHFQDHADYFPG
ncbi:MAG: hypothetical protein ACLUL2_06225 [Blautia sp.]